jgi:hypothetical protein
VALARRLAAGGPEHSLDAEKFEAAIRALEVTDAANLGELLNDPEHRAVADALRAAHCSIELKHWTPTGEGK